MSDKKRERNPPNDIDLNLGLGGLFKGLGEMMDLVAEMMEHSRTETQRSGEFQVKGMGKRMRGVYGFSIRTGIGGMPQVERFGHVRATENSPDLAEVREPLVDIFDEGNEVVLIAEIPGVDVGDISIEVVGDILLLETKGERRYAREILLPAAVEANSLHKTYRNGILELRLVKRAH